ncbi:hypothetical protein [Rummeliibacillus pycnus]|uniref:hypothetical protein n=1 Tax=Rummeliibacillus pycnus TaxID=101070 RepID=UPI000C9CFF42|nr:hypothetical protein [Rummeliibacillus pycnus]
MEKIVFETQQSYYEYIQNVVKGCQNISDHLREDNTSEALQEIYQFTEGIDWLVKVEELMLHHNFTIQSHVREAVPFLIEINESLDKQDFVYVADLFEYELQPIFEKCQNEKFKRIEA